LRPTHRPELLKALEMLALLDDLDRRIREDTLGDYGLRDAEAESG